MNTVLNDQEAKRFLKIIEENDMPKGKGYKGKKLKPKK